MRGTTITTWSAALGLGMVISTAATGWAAPSSTHRIQGGDRYDTSVQVSKELVPTPSSFQVVYVASGDNFPDALAAAPATQGWGQPVPLLLVPKDGALPASITGELDRLKPQDVYVVGGGAAVSDVVLGQLKHWDPNVQRISGANRYDTAADVSFASGSPGGTVFLATGLDYPDALAGAAVAARTESALLLTDPHRLPPETSEVLKDYLKPSRVVVLGSPGVVSDDVVNAVKAAVPGVEVQRLGGGDRYETAALVSRYGYPAGAPGILMATGANFPDALAAGPLSAALGEPVLLSRQGCAPAPTVTEFARLAATSVTALGGTAVLSDAAAGTAPC